MTGSKGRKLKETIDKTKKIVNPAPLPLLSRFAKTFEKKIPNKKVINVPTNIQR